MSKRLILIFSMLMGLTSVLAQDKMEGAKVGYPLYPTRAAYCDQGNNSPTGNSHNLWNTKYAMDLKTPGGTMPASIYAAIDGEVIAYVGCQSHNTDCGNGFGNQVKILGKNGILVFYAHLEKSFVKTGEQVRKGQVIGVEGNTGLTGANNRHLHFSVHYDWRYRGRDFYLNVGYLPESVPFMLQACQESRHTCNNEYNPSTKFACKRTTGNTDWIHGTSANF